MINQIKEAIRRTGTDIIYLDEFNELACYLPEYDVVYIQAGLPEHQEITVLSHELTHITEDKEKPTTYVESYYSHVQSENIADMESIKISLAHYLKSFDFFENSEVTYTNFMDYYGIDYIFEDYVRKIFPIFLQATS
jgi:hypothetical protein